MWRPGEMAFHSLSASTTTPALYLITNHLFCMNLLSHFHYNFANYSHFWWLFIDPKHCLSIDVVSWTLSAFLFLYEVVRVSYLAKLLLQRLYWGKIWAIMGCVGEFQNSFACLHHLEVRITVYSGTSTPLVKTERKHSKHCHLKPL